MESKLSDSSLNSLIKFSICRSRSASASAFLVCSEVVGGIRRMFRCLLCILRSVLLVRGRNAFVCWR